MQNYKMINFLFFTGVLNKSLDMTFLIKKILKAKYIVEVEQLIFFVKIPQAKEQIFYELF